jgi:NTP pyrophosphatase (non-canonical NTP hydrolase)
MNDFKDLTRLADTFRTERDWKQFHNLKDMVISLCLECSELLEIFQWKASDEILEQLETVKGDIENELSDILYWLLVISKDLDIDLVKAFMKKIELNSKKYPTDRAKGSCKKYTQL